MHHDPYLPTAFWIAAAAVSTVVYWTVFTRWMPTRTTRLRAASAPVLLAIGGYAVVSIGVLRTVELLSLYTFGLLGFVVGLLGRHKELARLALDQERSGRTRDNRPPLAMVCQLLATLLVLCGIALFVY